MGFVAALNRAAIRAFKPIAAPMRNTLTPDNGKELAARKSLSQALGPLAQKWGSNLYL
jgi:IS30 family transposase